MLAPTWNARAGWRILGHLAAAALVSSCDGTLSAEVPVVNPHDVALADFDGDGALDVAVATGAAENVVLYNGGEGRAFTSLAVPMPDEDRGAYSIAAADVTGDGAPDLLVAEDFGARLIVFRNDGAGGFGLGGLFDGGWSLGALVAGDLEGDGDTDVVGLDRDLAAVNVFENDGTGQLRLVAFPNLGNAPVGLALGDLDGDGTLEIVATHPPERTWDAPPPPREPWVTVLVYLGTAGFEGVAVPTLAFPEGPLAVGDADGDGDLDLALTGADPDFDLFCDNPASERVSLLFNDGTGRVFAEASIRVGTCGVSPAALALGDLDGDGDLDLAVVRPYGNDVRVMRNDDSGGFRSWRDWRVRDRPGALELGDLDGDGILDIVTAHLGDDLLSIALMP